MLLYVDSLVSFPIVHADVLTIYAFCATALPVLRYYFVFGRSRLSQATYVLIIGHLERVQDPSYDFVDIALLITTTNHPAYTYTPM